MKQFIGIFLVVFGVVAVSEVVTAQTISISPDPGGNIRIRIDGATNEVYAVESATRIPPLFWEVRATGTTDISGMIEWLETNTVAGATRFYRAAAGSITRPQATTTSVQGTEDQLLTFMLEANDPFNIPFHAIVTELPAVGTLQQFDGTPILSAPATVSDSARRLRFVAPQDDNGSPLAGFSYLVQRESDNVCSTTKNVAINVTPVNDLPFGTVPSVQFDEDSFAVVQLSAADPDLSREGDSLSFQIVFAPVLAAMYQVENDGVTRGALVVDGDMVMNTNHLVIVEAPPNANGLPFDSFTYQASDSHAGKSPMHEVGIYVTPLNDPPVTGDLVQPVPGTTRQMQFNFVASDMDSGSPLILIDELSGRGHLYHTSISPENEIATNDVIENGNLFFTVDSYDCPAEGDHGTNYLVVKFRARDAEGLLSGQGTLVFDVAPRVLPPYPTHSLSFTNQNYETNRIELVMVEPQGLAYVRTVTQLPQHGTLYYAGHNISELSEPIALTTTPVNLPVPPFASYPILYYVPTNGFTGNDSFRYTAKNSSLIETCQPIQVDFTVLGSSPDN